MSVPPEDAGVVLPSLDNTMGALYIGVLTSATLYGLTCLQTGYYYAVYRKDRWVLKMLVGTIWVLDTLHQLLITHAAYVYMVSNYSRPAILETVVWSAMAQVIVNGITAVLVQTFFVWRIYVLSRKSCPYLCVPAAVFSLAGFCLISAYTGKVRPLKTWAEIDTVEPLSLTVNGLTLVTDIFIAASLVYLLRRSRTGFSNSDSMINTLILYSVNTGLLTSLDAVCSLITYVASRKTFVYISFFFALGRLYSNSLLATLNARGRISARREAGFIEGSFADMSRPRDAENAFGTGERRQSVHIHVNIRTQETSQPSEDNEVDSGSSSASEDKRCSSEDKPR